jgi:hypothetical protein
MFLSLRKEVEIGNKPEIAVFNYADFHIERTPLCYGEWVRAWNSAFQFNYPYATIENDSIIIKKMLSKDFHKDFIFRDKSALINLIESIYNIMHDRFIRPDLFSINYKLALEIVRYCSIHDIKLIFAGIDSESLNMLNNLKEYGVETLYYDIDISLPENNCYPIDEYHPNSHVHKIYSEKIIDCLDKKGWLSNSFK